jgi:hypothetical protein
VEQEESEEQQWQHEVQIVEEQRTLERRLSSPPSVTTAKPAVVKMRSFSMSMPVLRNDIDDIGGRKVMGHVQTALRESPQESMNSWEAENEPLLAFFYSQLNPSKVRDVSQVLRIFRDNNEGLNVSLRKTYGIDLTASPEEIRQQAGTRAQDSPGPCMLWLSAPSSGFSVSNTELFTQEQTEESRLL